MTLSNNVSTGKLHIELEVKELMHALNFANSVLEKKNVMLELSHIKLVADNNTLEIIATDMDLSLTQRVPAQIFEQGESIVPGSMFTEIIRKIPDKQITLKQDHNKEQIEIMGKNCSFNLVTLPKDKRFPSLEKMNASHSLQIPCKQFIRLIDYAQFAMSNEETRYNLNGIYFHSKPIVNRLYTAATDGHRLSVATCNTDKEIESFGAILPKKTVQEILKIAKDSHNIDSEMRVDIGLNRVKFLCNNTTMISKLIDGTFPEYDNFIPVNHNNKLEVNSKVLADAIDRVSTVTIDKFRAVKIILNKEHIEITASGEDRGSAKEKLRYQNSNDEKLIYSGEELAIGFNPKYLMDVLSAIKQENIEIYLKDAASPILIKLASSPSDSFVIMPVKI